MGGTRWRRRVFRTYVFRALCVPFATDVRVNDGICVHSSGEFVAGYLRTDCRRVRVHNRSVSAERGRATGRGVVFCTVGAINRSNREVFRISEKTDRPIKRTISINGPAKKVRDHHGSISVSGRVVVNPSTFVPFSTGSRRAYTTIGLTERTYVISTVWASGGSQRGRGTGHF